MACIQKASSLNHGHRHSIRQFRHIWQDVRIKKLSISRNQRHSPTPEWPEPQVLRYTGFTVRRGLSQTDAFLNALAHTEHPANVDMQIHPIAQVPYLLIHIKRLRRHINNASIMTLELKEITHRVLKPLKIAGIPYHSHLIQEQNRVSHGHKVTQLLNINEPDAGDSQIRHIGIDCPSTPGIFQGHFHQISTLSTPLFAKNQVKAVRIQVFPSKAVINQERTEKENQKSTKKSHKNTP